LAKGGGARQAVKLHLGCGRKKLEGWLNCDLHDSDWDMDIRDLPFADNSVSEIMAIHVCEHFYRHELTNVMVEWHRVLKVGGKIALELPCLDRVLSHFMSGSPDNLTLWALYGAPNTHQDGEPALHKWCWSKAEFRKVLEQAGFKNIMEETPHYHVPSRDMRFVAMK
jgi:predicted SAM-dependent methyltransferase